MTEPKPTISSAPKTEALAVPYDQLDKIVRGAVAAAMIEHETKLEKRFETIVHKELEERFGNVTAEDHMRHHSWMDGLINFSEKVSDNAIGTIVKTVILAFFTVMVYGLILWMQLSANIQNIPRK